MGLYEIGDRKLHSCFCPSVEIVSTFVTLPQLHLQCVKVTPLSRHNRHIERELHAREGYCTYALLCERARLRNYRVVEDRTTSTSLPLAHGSPPHHGTEMTAASIARYIAPKGVCVPTPYFVRYRSTDGPAPASTMLRGFRFYSQPGVSGMLRTHVTRHVTSFSQ